MLLWVKARGLARKQNTRLHGVAMGNRCSIAHLQCSCYACGKAGDRAVP